MKSLYDMVIKLFISVVSLFVISFPVLGVIQWLGPKNAHPYDDYKILLSKAWIYINQYGAWGSVVILSIILIGFADNFHSTAETVRINRLITECRRWRKTPYIPPYLYFSLVSPRGSFSGNLRSRVFNEYYKTCVSLFKERVFVNASFSKEDPEQRPNWLQVAGKNLIVPIVFSLLIIVGFFAFLYQIKSPNTWFNGWDKFAIPFLAFISAWSGQLIYASFYYGSFKDVEEDMFDYFHTDDPKITWREVFPDRPKGESILLAWKHETTSRNSLHYDYLRKIHGSSAPLTECPSLASHPFPNEEIPVWADDMERDIYNSINRWKEDKVVHHKVKKGSKGEIVTLSFKKR